MAMKKEKIENKIIESFMQLSFVGKILVLGIFLFSIIGNIILITTNISTSNRLYDSRLKYKTDIDRAQERYFLLSLENSNLRKKIQELNLELAVTLNNTVELQVMMNQVNEENITLASIKTQLTDGIRRTNQQLQLMQGSVNKMIESRHLENEAEELEILKQKGKLPR